MIIEEARAIYRQGEEATVKFIMDLDARYQKLENKIAVLEKNSRTSSKRPSSDDITKNKRNKNKKKGAREKKNDFKNELNKNIVDYLCVYFYLITLIFAIFLNS
jgi:hypothetical protein